MSCSRGSVERTLTWWLALLALGVVLAAPRHARAQFVVGTPPSAPSEAEVARARESFNSALAHAESGRWPQAVLAFEEAYRRSGNPVALLNLAVALRESGRTADARSCVRELELRHDAQLDPETRSAASEVYKSVTAIVEVQGTLPAGAALSIDGERQLPGRTRFELDAGPHRVEVSAPAHAPSAWRVTAIAGQQTHVVYRAQPLADPTSVAPVLEAREFPSPEPGHDAPSKRRLARWAVGLIVSGAALAVGAAVAIPLIVRNQGMDPPSGVDARYELP